MSDSMLQSLAVSFDSRQWQGRDPAGRSLALAPNEEAWLPDLPDGTAAGRLLLPVEQMFARSFTLALSHPRFIDAEIMAQELNERSGERAKQWWLAWQAGRSGDGVAGLLFGLPEAWRQQIESHPQWRQVGSVAVDALERLEAQRSGAAAVDVDADAPLAVIDADADGLFFGVWQAAERSPNGIWRGVRRLNNGEPDELAWQVRKTLSAMGWQEGMAVGRLGTSLLTALQLEGWQGSGVEDAELPSRQAANLALSAKTTLEFRHGSWAVRSWLGWVRPWRRSLMLAAAVVLAWTLGTAWQVHSMSAQAEQYRQRINDAFHRGLPSEPVMIDALAQLRRAAGSGGDSGRTAQWLNQLQAIGRVHGQTPWLMQELSFADEAVKLSGRADDLQTLNRIREQLQQETGREVRLSDTDLSDGKVAFRMHWQ